MTGPPRPGVVTADFTTDPFKTLVSVDDAYLLLTDLRTLTLLGEACWDASIYRARLPDGRRAHVRRLDIARAIFGYR